MSTYGVMLSGLLVLCDTVDLRSFGLFLGWLERVLLHDVKRVLF